MKSSGKKTPGGAVAWSCGCVVGFGWMVVRFVRVIRVPACAREPCVPCMSRTCVSRPPGVFLPGGAGTCPFYRGEPGHTGIKIRAR